MNRQKLVSQIRRYVPYKEQEEAVSFDLKLDREE